MRIDMRLIAHRGNTHGRKLDLENKPIQVEACASLGYDIEVDLRFVEGCLFLGHDTPDHEVSFSWMESLSDRLWVHCKNHEALDFMFGSNFNYFWHDTDDYTITSKGFVWAYPGKRIVKNCIAVMPESWAESKYLSCKGICSDLISEYISVPS